MPENEKYRNGTFSECETICSRIIRSMPNFSLMTFDTELRVLMIEGEFWNYLKLSKKSYIGKKITDIQFPHSLNNIFHYCVRAIKGDSIEMDFELNDITFKVYFTPIKDEKEDIIAGVISINDIDIIREKENQITEVERKYKHLTENASDVVYRFELLPERKYSYVNPAIKEMLGYIPEDLYNDSDFLSKIIYPDDLRLLRSLLSQTESNKESVTLRWIHKNGQIVWAEHKNTPIYNNSKSLIAIEGIARDVSGRKSVEAEIRHRLEFERVISDVSTYFAKAGMENLQESIDYSLKKIGELSKVDRAFLYVFDKNITTMSNIGEWCNVGIESNKEGLQNISSSLYPWWINKILTRESFFIEDINKMGQDAENEKDLFSAQSVKSLVAVPVKFLDNVIGFIGYHSVKLKRLWTQEDILLLKITGEIVGTTLQRKKLKEEFKNKERQFEIFFQNASDSIFIYDIWGKILEVNETGCKKFGYSLEEFLNMSPMDMISENSAALFPSIIEILLKEKQFTYETELITKNGVIIPVEVSSRLINYNKRDVIISFVRDITVRKKNEEELGKTYRSLDILGNCNIALILTETEEDLFYEYCYILINDASYDFVWIGKSRNIYESVTLTNHIPVAYSGNESDVEKIFDDVVFHKECPLAHTILNKKPNFCNDINTKANCKCYLLDYNYRAVISIPIMVKGIFYGTMNIYSKKPNIFDENEINLLVDVENHLEYGITSIFDKMKRYEVEEALAREKEELSITLKSINDGVITTDFFGYIVMGNKSAYSILDLPEGYLNGLNILEIVFNPPKEYNYENIDTFLSSINIQINQETQINYNTKEGLSKILLINYSELKDPSNKINGFVFIIRDITDRIVIENQLALSQKMESIGQLAAGIAHEMNTPMQYIGDNVSFLKDAIANLNKFWDTINLSINKIEDNEFAEIINSIFKTAYKHFDIDFYLNEIPQAIDQTQTGISKVSNIISAMKDFSHPKLQEKSYSDLNHSIEITITISKNVWKYCADLETEYYNELPLVYCAIDEINQVILNLIVNATHAIQERFGNEPLSKGLIKIKTGIDGEYGVICITDNGIGIPEENLSKIFVPFFTTKEVGKGTGQGLAISHDIIVNKHNGKIFVDSKRNQGTEFKILLPISE